MNVISSDYHANQVTVAGHDHGVQPPARHGQKHPTAENTLDIYV